MADEEKEAIRYYFSKNYDYQTILRFLKKFHDINISRGTLLNRLKEYGLRRRRCVVNEGNIRHCIQQELDGSGGLLGYRAMWRKLHFKYGINVPRSVVQDLLFELDPEGCNARRVHRLKRREYLNPGPNHCWHSDGYDKLKPFGFPIHGCIDGFSRRVIWLRVTRTNNDPNVISRFFLESIQQVGGCPTIVRTDRGTENGLMATAQCFLRRNDQDPLSSLWFIPQQSTNWGLVGLLQAIMELMVDLLFQRLGIQRTSGMLITSASHDIILRLVFLTNFSFCQKQLEK